MPVPYAVPTTGRGIAHLLFLVVVLKPALSIPSFLYCVAFQIQGLAPDLSGVEFFEMEVAVCEEEKEVSRKLVRIR